MIVIQSDWCPVLKTGFDHHFITTLVSSKPLEKYPLPAFQEMVKISEKEIEVK